MGFQEWVCLWWFWIFFIFFTNLIEIWFTKCLFLFKDSHSKEIKVCLIPDNMKRN